ncbi:hypothetical protein RhiirA4_480365 [Rhizophagus irregularis]|uniref:Uncharacterized protein n=1 Tax=Rhizophagus irregularis TaxID=588596 RepID=A0A2I1HHU0_9GLOM|nr:hypothetical protein RhiirA4_480365 [Rhizophagus irregularis]
MVSNYQKDQSFQEKPDQGGKNKSKISKQRLIQLEQELAQFNIDYYSIIDPAAQHIYYKGETSDDIKELEHRPNKCNILHHTNLHLDHEG